MKVGYARISTDDQTLDLQRDALTAAGCTRFFEDTASGATVERVGLQQVLAYVRAGDTVVVWRLDRLGRSLKALIELLNGLREREVGFVSLTEQIDTTTPGGKLIFHVFGALAEFERDLIRERTNAGLAAARARGRKGGRPRAAAFADPKQAAMARDLYQGKHHSVADICRTLKVSRATLYRYLQREPSAQSEQQEAVASRATAPEVPVRRQRTAQEEGGA